MDLTKRVSQDAMTMYSGPGNIHSDVEVARRTGLETTIAQGMMTLAYASELMTRLVGHVWLEQGSMAVTFTKPVVAGDTVTVSATEHEGSYVLEARVARGELVMVGKAWLRCARASGT